MDIIRERQLRRRLLFSKEDHQKVIENFKKEEELYKKIKEEENKKKAIEEENKKKTIEEENKKKIIEEENRKKEEKNELSFEEIRRLKREKMIENLRIKKEAKNNNIQNNNQNNNQNNIQNNIQNNNIQNQKNIKKVYSYTTNENIITVPENIRNKNITIVIAHYSENLDWIQNLQYPYIVISKGGLRKEYFPNKGCEASSYLEYIINNYNNLSTYTLFLHGHRNSWHHKSNIDEKVNNLIFNKPYYNINELKIDKIMIGNEEYRKMLEHDFHIKYDRKNKHLYRPAAQFYVHKDLILRNSKETYEKYYNFLRNTKESSYSTSRYFEYSWHIIFTHNNNDVE